MAGKKKTTGRVSQTLRVGVVTTGMRAKVTLPGLGGEKVLIGNREYKISKDDRVNLPARYVEALGLKKGQKFKTLFASQAIGTEKDPKTHRWKYNYVLYPYHKKKHIEIEPPLVKYEIEGEEVEIPYEMPVAY